MPITNYPFVDNGDGRPRPFLPVVLENPHSGTQYLTWALIDTGADGIVIPGHIATLLNHDNTHKDVKAATCRGLGGESKTYYHTFNLRVLARSPSRTILKKAAIHMTNQELVVAPGLTTMLLGVKEFLVKYVLSIDYPQKMFSVKSP